MAANADPPVPVAQSVNRETDAYEWYQSYLASQSRDPNKRHRRGLLIRDEASDDLLLKAVAWAQLWRDSCSCDRPNPVFIKSALLALEASASAWGKSRPDTPRRREWSVLARYLRLHAWRLRRGSIAVPPKYGSLDKPTPAARRAARMLADNHFRDRELAFVVALHGLASLDGEQIEACRFDLATFGKARGKPNPIVIRSALLALQASASAWGKNQPNARQQREWAVLARYLRLHAARLRRGDTPVQPKYGSLDAPTPAARRAARMLVDDRFLDRERALYVALTGFANLERNAFEACPFDHTDFDKSPIEATLSVLVGKSYKDRLTRADVRLAKGNRGRPRKGLDESSAGNEPAGAALQNAWRKSGD